MTMNVRRVFLNGLVLAAVASAAVVLLAQAPTVTVSLADLKYLQTEASAIGKPRSSADQKHLANIKAKLAALMPVVVPPPPPPPVVDPPPPVVTPPPPPPPPPATGLVAIADLNAGYIGSFKLPAGVFDYSVMGLAYNPAKNSLYVSGLDTAGNIGEVSIPAIGGRATLLQPLADPTEGKLTSVSSPAQESRVGGMYLRPSDGKLIVSGYAYYDAGNTQRTSFFVRPASLGTKGQVAGPFPAVGAPLQKMASGYFATIPEAWRAAFGGNDLLAGLCCTNIISTSSYGPSMGVMKADDIGVGNAWKGVVYYPSSNPLHNVWNVTSDIFNGSTKIAGVLFIRDSVIFIGRQGTGPYCYGIPGTDCPADPADQYKGVHTYPYRHQVWMYDAHDLAAVYAGTKQPWQVQPYAYGALGGMPTGGTAMLTGAAYDMANGLAYIGEYHADGPSPVIHVFKIK